MKRTLLILISILISHFLLGQNAVVPYQEDDLWGFKNKEGKTLTEAKYKFAKSLSDGYGVFFIAGEIGSLDAKAGLIDSLGNIIISPKEYRQIDYMGNDLFEVWRQGTYFGQFDKGIINQKGEFIVPVEYRNISKTGDYFVVNKVIDSIVGHFEGMDQLRPTSTKGVYSIVGKQILPAIYDRIEPLNNKSFAIKDSLNFALFSSDFKQLTGFEYSRISNFYTGLARVQKNNLLGFVNEKGEEVIACKYPSIGLFYNGYALVIEDENQYFIKTSEQKIFSDFEFTPWFYFYEDQVLFKDQKKFGLAALDGEILLPAIYDGFKKEFRGITFFGKDGEWQIWDASQNQLLPTKYKDVILVENNLESIHITEYVKEKVYPQSIAIVEKDGEWGLVNLHGEIVEPFGTDKNELLQYIVY